MIEVPAELQAEREALIAEIHAAFEGVTREGGVSWSETDVIDGYGSDEERRIARLRDKDTSWTELVMNEHWNIAVGFGGWSFLDAIGFRYYLPAGMVRNICDGWQSDISFQLTLNKATKPRGFELQEHTKNKWSLLNDRQRRCVTRFIRFMISWEELTAQEDDPEYRADDWRTAYDRYWKQFD